MCLIIFIMCRYFFFEIEIIKFLWGNFFLLNCVQKVNLQCEVFEFLLGQINRYFESCRNKILRSLFKFFELKCYFNLKDLSEFFEILFLQFLKYLLIWFNKSLKILYYKFIF